LIYIGFLVLRCRRVRRGLVTLRCKKMQSGVSEAGRGQRRAVPASSVRHPWGRFYLEATHRVGSVLWIIFCYGSPDVNETTPVRRSERRRLLGGQVRSRLEALHFSRKPERSPGS
jgi:hypothetical protein